MFPAQWNETAYGKSRAPFLSFLFYSTTDIMRNRFSLSLAILATSAALAGAQDRVVHIGASDYKFTAPDSIAAGFTTFRLVGHGPEIHHVQVARLEEGKTFADFMEAMKSHGPPPSWVTFVGGPNAGIPNGQHAITVSAYLPAGNYVLVCLIPSPDGVPHVAKGMHKPLTVTKAPAAVVQAGTPKVDAVMTLYDYNFDLDKPLTAGRRTIQVKNTASQFHEAFLAKLPPGTSPTAMMDWVAGGMKGPPPIVPMGGIVALTRGQENFITVDLEEGDYALYCFLPDAKDGKEHVQHGMFKKITVTK